MAYTPLENCEQTEAEEEGGGSVRGLLLPSARVLPPNCDIERLKMVSPGDISPRPSLLETRLSDIYLKGVCGFPL